MYFSGTFNGLFRIILVASNVKDPLSTSTFKISPGKPPNFQGPIGTGISKVYQTLYFLPLNSVVADLHLYPSKENSSLDSFHSIFGNSSLYITFPFLRIFVMPRYSLE